MKIRKLPKEVYDLIAAGEVVLAPVSVVKELVENSIDAGASRIIVEMAGGGIGRVRVSDNGSGIEREDVELAFAPHATSKLGIDGGAEELSRIETLGFRGEALASIAAVSSVTLVTKTVADDGVRAFIEGGSELSLSPAGADTGTDITIERLFFNIPARKKHLGDMRTEGRRITEYVSKAAASRPDVAFRLISDGVLVFSTLGNGDRMAAIAAVYGSKTAEHLLPVTAGQAGLRLEGYISGVLGMRGNRKGQHFFVNGRPVANAAFERAVSRAYREFAEHGRFPVVFLLLEIDPSMVDVNVHPAKNEISFVSPRDVEDFICSALINVLNSGSSIPKLKLHGRQAPDDTFSLKDPEEAGAFGPNGKDAGNNDEYWSGVKERSSLISTSGGSGHKLDSVDINKLLATDGAADPGNETNVRHGLRYDELVDHNIFPSTNLIAEGDNQHYEKAFNFNIKGLETLTILFAAYILATDGDTLYIIDQHAAHERINYERFRGEYKWGGIQEQALLRPYLFTPPASLGNLADYTGFLMKIGYQIDDFGGNTWAARTFPAFIPFEEGEAFLLECLASLGGEREDCPDGVSHAAAERIIKRACKASVKANRALSKEECDALLKELSVCDNPYTCPHGRPVFLKLGRTDIERLFKRV